MPHDVMPWWGYAAQWNLLDYPCGVLPAGTVLESDEYPKGYEPVNDLDRENMNLCESFCMLQPPAALIADFGADDNKMYRDMPVAIQVVGPTYEDEKVLGAMSIIDEVVKGYPPIDWNVPVRGRFRSTNANSRTGL